MKKILSLMICIAVLAGSFCFTTSAAEKDMALYYDDGLARPTLAADATEDQKEDFDPAADMTGISGQIFNNEEWAAADGGYTMAFDFNFMDYTVCNHVFDKADKAHPSHFSLHTGTSADGFGTVFAYNAIDGRFEIAKDSQGYQHGTVKVEGPDQTYFVVDSYDMRLQPGEWHRVVFRIEDIYLDIYVDGVHIIETTTPQVGHDWVMLNPQHCRFMMDNLVFGTIFYDIEADYNDENYLETAIAEGLVYEHCDFDNLEHATSVDEETGEIIVHDHYDMCGLNNVGTFSEKDPIKLVDRNSHASLLVESAEASALSFTDVAESGVGKTFTSDLVYKGADAVDAQLALLTDWCIDFKEVTDVADGCTVTVSGGKATIKIPAGFTGEKVATFSFELPMDESELKLYPTQHGTYRFGLYDETGAVLTDGGSVFIVNFVLGDVNDDRSIDNKDVALMLRYTARWEVSINYQAANIENDDLINMKDLIHILRYLAGFDNTPLGVPPAA